MLKIVLPVLFIYSTAMAQQIPLKNASVTPEIKQGSVVVRCDCCDRSCSQKAKNIAKAKPKQPICKPKVVEKIVERPIEQIKYIDRPVPYEKEVEGKKNAISFSIGAGIDRLHLRTISDGVTEVSPKRVAVYGLRYDRDFGDMYRFSLEGLTTQSRLMDFAPPFETGTVSFGFKF